MTKIERLTIAVKHTQILARYLDSVEKTVDPPFVDPSLFRYAEIRDAIDNIRDEKTRLLALFAEEFAEVDDGV